MPFDALTFTPAITDTPSLEALSYALRHQETWPVGFEWDYNHCGRCAMGLACRLWHLKRGPLPENMVPVFQIREDVAVRVFWRLHSHLGLAGREHITPEHVADAIDFIVASRA